ncbi:unnamed protein product [Miscanthus lutarioriparius]|uniref:Glycosyltransferase n=1 Tax=Miscanthus lutarioriparius TaxID=422564 RepID=A0A811MWQ2_9POAL|nr:unnamed protein product [Miscanthus lutarioriparius]
MGSSHVAVVAFPFASHAPKLLMVARALATAAPTATFSFISTADSLARLGIAAVPGNLRFVEVPAAGGDDQGTMPWRRMELFVEAAEAGGLRQALEMARAAAGGAMVSCVVGDAFMSMAAEAGVPWVAVWTGGPCALLAHLIGDAIREDIGDQAANRADELLTSHPGLGSYRVRDLPFGGVGASGDTHRVMSLLLSRLAQRLPRAATAVALNAFPGLFPQDVSAALADALPNSLPIGPYHLLPGAAAPADDPHGCLAWLAQRPAGTVAYVSFGTVAALPPDELRELASGLEASGAPFLWSLREDAWALLPPGFVDRAKANGSGLLVPWTPQAAVLRHPAVGAFVTHSGWGAVVEGMSGGVPMACRPFFGDQQMNARAAARMWCFGTAFGDDTPMTSGGVAEVVTSLLTGAEGARMRATARDLQARVVKAFGPDGGSLNNFHKFVEVVCARV